MPVTGLFFLPVPPNGTSPSTALISHISGTFPAQPLSPYFVDHRLLSDTESFFPGADPTQRRHTQYLTVSHLPGKAYLGTSTVSKDGAAPPSTGIMSIIAVPRGPAAEDCYGIIVTKMQPLWHQRQIIRIDNGTSLELNNGDWRMRVGDARIRSKQGQWNVRGVVVEVEYCGDEEDEEVQVDGQEGEKGQADWHTQEQMLRAFFEAITRESGVAMDDLRVVVKVPGVRKTEPPAWVLVRQYMELLRLGRTL